MPSTMIRKRVTVDGRSRFEVRFKLGGRESSWRSGGTFGTRREADERLRWIRAEIASMRVPDVGLEARVSRRVTVASAAELWRRSRYDVNDATRKNHRNALAHVLPTFGDRDVESLTPAEVGAWVGELAGKLSPATVRHVVSVFAMVLDHYGVVPNPVRDPRVKLPRRESVIVTPPTAAQVEAMLAATAPAHVLPLVVLEQTGMRAGELLDLTWGDLDSPRGRWRIARGKTAAARRWVVLPADLFAVVEEIQPREDRREDGRVFYWCQGDRLRAEMRRACRAAGVPHAHPHDLRHRRISLLHRAGVPWAEIGARVGQTDLATTANTYSHVVLEGEIDRPSVLARWYARGTARYLT